MNPLAPFAAGVVFILVLTLIALALVAVTR